MKRAILDWIRRGAACGLLALSGSAVGEGSTCVPEIDQPPPSTDPLDWSPDDVELPVLDASVTLDGDLVARLIEVLRATRPVERDAAAGRISPEAAARRIRELREAAGFDDAAFRVAEQRTYTLIGLLHLEDAAAIPASRNEIELVTKHRDELEALLL